MSLFSDIIISIPFGVIYTIFMQKLSDIVLDEYKGNDKLQKSLTFIFFAGLIAMIIAQTIFMDPNNRLIKQSLMVGGIICTGYISLTNWEKMTDYTKLFILGLSLGGIVWVIYQRQQNQQKRLIKPRMKQTRQKSRKEQIDDEFFDDLTNDDDE